MYEDTDVRLATIGHYFFTGAGALQPPLALTFASYGGPAVALAKAGTPGAT
jgi:hypothetical protein